MPTTSQVAAAAAILLVLRQLRLAQVQTGTGKLAQAGLKNAGELMQPAQQLPIAQTLSTAKALGTAQARLALQPCSWQQALHQQAWLSHSPAPRTHIHKLASWQLTCRPSAVLSCPTRLVGCRHRPRPGWRLLPR